jgi:hypothetical protein
VKISQPVQKLKGDTQTSQACFSPRKGKQDKNIFLEAYIAGLYMLLRAGLPSMKSNK